MSTGVGNNLKYKTKWNSEFSVLDKETVVETAGLFFGKNRPVSHYYDVCMQEDYGHLKLCDSRSIKIII